MFEDYIEPLENVKSILNLIQKISIFGGLSNEELKNIFELSLLAKLPNKCKLFSPGDSPNYIYILIKGAIKLYITNDNVQYEFVSFKIGDCFGEASMVSIEPHSATAICESDCELVVLSRKSFLKLHKTNPVLFSKLILNIARELGRRLHKTNSLLFEYVGHKHGSLIKVEKKV